MRSQMSKRERVEATLQRQETDRAPVYDILVNDAVIEHFTGRRPPIGEEGLKLRLQATAQTLDMTRMVAIAPQPPGDTVDADGFVHYRQDHWIGGGIRHRPFHDEEGAKNWLVRANARMREPFDIGTYTASFRADHERCRSYLGDDTVVIYEYGPGLDWVRYSLGLEFFSYLSVDAPELISEYIEQYTAREIQKIHATADPHLTPCALTYGDIAYKGALLHSPEWLRREFYPPLQRINAALHQHDIKCLFHSDGYLMEAIDDLLDAGIDGLNPIEVVAGMDLRTIAAQYGDRLFFAGGIDISQLMANGTPDQVRQACREAIDAAGPGYFIGSTTELDNGSRLENVLAMLETAWENPNQNPRRPP